MSSDKPKPKSHALRPGVQKKIAEYAFANPNASRKDIAKRFCCTERQVWYAEQRYELGELDPKTNKQRVGTARRKAALVDVENTFESEQRMVLSQLTMEELNATQRTEVLKGLVYIKRHQQALALESHIKRTDAALIKLIVQRFQPDATDDDVIKIYREAYEQWKHSAY